MSAALTFAIGALVGILVGGSAATVITYSVAAHRADALAEQVAEDQAGAAAALQAKSADLAACLAEQAPKTVDAAGRVVAAANAPEIADVQLRAAVVSAMPQTIYAEAIVQTGNARLIAVEGAMARCAASNTTGDSSRSGCSREVPAAWAETIQALSACVEPAP